MDRRERRRLLGLALLAASCGEAPSPIVRAAEEPREVATPEADLAALGYVDYRVDPADEVLLEENRPLEASELVVSVPGASSPGFRLVTAIPQGRALLVDGNGDVQNEWSESLSSHWKRATLAPNGDLVVVEVLDPQRSTVPATETGDSGADARPNRHLARLDWDGRLLWRRKVAVHHDVTVTPSGRLLSIVSKDREDGDREVTDERLTLFTREGEIQRAVSLYDALLPLEGEIDLSAEPRVEGDLIHANSAKWISSSQEGHPRVLVTSRNLDLVATVDFDTGEILWFWGQGELEGPHEATELPSGNVLIFDNGSKGRGFSRLVEVDPRTDRIEWEYRAGDPADFYCEARGTAQALESGNVLVGNTIKGEVFEVTRKGRLVWLFRLRDALGRRVALRAAHYAEPWVEALLEEESE